MTLKDDRDIDPRIRVKKQVIGLGQDYFYTYNLLRMKVTCEERPVSMRDIGGTKMAGGMVTTNGKTLNFHPEYVRQITDERVAYHLKKAVLQVALKHHLVKDKYPNVDPSVLSLASSLSINYILRNDEGMPEGAPQAGTPNTFFEYLNIGESMEHYVDALQDAMEKEQEKQKQQQQQQEKSAGKGKGKGRGDASPDSQEQDDDKNQEGDDEQDEGKDGDSDNGKEQDNKSSKDKGKSKGKGKKKDQDDLDDWSDSGNSDEEGDEESDEDSDSDSDGDPDETSDEEGQDPSENADADSGDELEQDMPPMDWDSLPDEMDAGDVEQHPDAGGDKAQDLREAIDQQVMQSVASATAHGQGDIPLEVKEMLEREIKPSKLDWKSTLRRFCTTFKNSGFTYQRPNRRTAWRSDVIMPSRKSRTIGKIVFAVDTSGSMTAEQINKSLDEIESVLKSWPNAELIMMECGTHITNTETVNKYNIANLKKGHTWTGRGGTDLRPPFKEAAKIGGVRCIVYLTDLYGPQPTPEEVNIPTMWLVTRDGALDKTNHYYPKFGEVVELKD